MLTLPSQRNQNFSLHFLPSLSQLLKLHRSNAITWLNMPSPLSHPQSSRSLFSQEGNCDPEASRNTIHSRRTMSRTESDPHGHPPPPLSGFSDLFHSRASTPISVSAPEESDIECWERMLALQRAYHCYNSARLEAAVEALEQGYGIEDVPMR